MATTSTSSKSSSTEEEKSEYDVPASTAEAEKPAFPQTVIRTSEDAVEMFLRDEIDEDQLAQAVNKYGKPSLGDANFRTSHDYEKELPTWLRVEPEGKGLKMEDRLKQVEEKEKVREEATKEAEADNSGSSSAQTAELPSSTATSSSSTSSSS